MLLPICLKWTVESLLFMGAGAGVGAGEIKLVAGEKWTGSATMTLDAVVVLPGHDQQRHGDLRQVVRHQVLTHKHTLRTTFSLSPIEGDKYPYPLAIPVITFSDWFSSN